MATYSAIIKNGTIFDGTKENVRFRADIAVNEDKIAKIGPLDNEGADIIIDASDLYVAPGFIDLTTHSDNHWTIFSQPLQESFIRQGITTITGGHGGSSLAPMIKKEAVRALERWTDVAKININWQTLTELFEELKKHHLGVNFATFVGHENLRRNILGNELRPADKKEIKTMCLLLEEVLKEGACGLSTNLGTQYSSVASDEEINKLLEITKKYDVVSSHHLEDEGKNLLPSISRLIMFLRSTESRGHIAHLKAVGRTAWDNFESALNMLELAQKDGLKITCDFFPYTRTGSNLISLLPSWILRESKDKILELLKDDKIRRDLTEYLKSLTLHYEKIIIATTLHDTGSVGKSIRELSRDSGLKEEKILLNLLEINNLQVAIFNEVLSAKYLDILAQKTYAAIASDGVGYEIKKGPSNQRRPQKDLPHPRSFGSFPRFFSQYVKDKSLISWEEAIHKMSGLPAEILKIKDRGAIKKNNCADIIIFNPTTIIDRSTYDNPWQYSEGIEYVFINGKLVLSNNKLEEEGAGKMLKKN